MKYLNLSLIKERAEKDQKDWYFDLPYPVKDVNCIKVSLYYDLGGWNYFSGVKKPRGYYVNITPISLSDTSEIMSLFGKTSGGYMFIESATRFNASRFNSQELHDLAEHLVTDNAQTMMVKIGAGYVAD